MLRRCSLVLLRGKNVQSWTAATSTTLSAPASPQATLRQHRRNDGNGSAGTASVAAAASAASAAAASADIDPAAQRNSARTAKPQRRWTLYECGDTPAGTTSPLSLAVARRTSHYVRVYVNLTRADRPAGWQFLVIPCYWGVGLAVTHALVFDGADPVTLWAPFLPPHLVVLFFAGAYLMRCAGCILNDLCDRRFDAHVARSAQRPLVRGEVGVPVAIGLMCAHALLALPVLLVMSPAAVTTALAIVPLTSVYALAKRYTHLPQLVLGLCYNWGIFVGYAAVLGRVDWAVCLPMYIAAVAWVLLYDTLYAYQDRPYDVRCGVKSLAVLLGDRKYVLHWLIVPMTVGLTWSGVAAAQTLPYYVGVLITMYQLNNIVDRVNIHDAWSCGQAFRANVRIGMYILYAMFAGNVLWALSSQHEPEHDARQDSAGATSGLLRHVFYAGAGERQPPPPQEQLEQEQQQQSSSSSSHGGDGVTARAAADDDASAATRAGPPRYDVTSVNWFDRLAHPIVVQAELAKANGATTPPAIPAWMRREYFGQNVATLLRWCGASEATVRAWDERWYAASDQYNMHSKYKL